MQMACVIPNRRYSKGALQRDMADKVPLEGDGVNGHAVAQDPADLPGVRIGGGSH